MVRKMQNKIEVFGKLFEENLYEYYQNFISSSNIEIYVIGDIEFDYIEKLIKEKFKFNVYKLIRKEHC